MVHRIWTLREAIWRSHGVRERFPGSQVAPGRLHRDDLSKQAWHGYFVVPAIAAAVSEHGAQDMDIARGNLALSWGSRAVPWIAGGARAFAHGRIGGEGM